MQRGHAHGFAIPNAGAMHILDFWVRLIPHASGAAFLASGVQWALDLRPAWKNEIMRMVSILWKISKFGATAARAHSFTFAPARLNRYPRITDAWGIRPQTLQPWKRAGMGPILPQGLQTKTCMQTTVGKRGKLTESRAADRAITA